MGRMGCLGCLLGSVEVRPSYHMLHVSLIPVQLGSCFNSCTVHSPMSFDSVPIALELSNTSGASTRPRGLLSRPAVFISSLLPLGHSGSICGSPGMPASLRVSDWYRMVMDCSRYFFAC
ncbi:hypothetical protein OG21DRAFT_189127 [Imleria badia]|nr:hypothetical protein OG21DRAFT_189127 [Imleria badia]